MFKLLTVICLCLAQSTISQTCSSTSALRSMYGLGNSLSTPTSYSDIQYCKSIKNSPVCCTDTDMNSFQTMSDKLITNLTATVATRDRFFAGVNANLLPALTASASNFEQVTEKFTTAFATANANPTNSLAYLTTLIGIASLLEEIGTSASQLATSFDSVQTDFGTYQKSRTSCVVQIVKLQNAARCLSCDPNANTKGYNPDTGAFTLSSAVCSKLKSSCYDFISTAEFQNGALLVEHTIKLMDAFSKLATSFLNGASISLSDFTLTSNDPQGASLPSTCTSQDDCDWICTDLFNNGMINQDNLAAGGFFNTTSSSRLLTERILDNGSFNPDDDEAGVSVTFQNDPGNADNTAKSGLLSFGSAFLGMMIMISSLLF